MFGLLISIAFATEDADGDGFSVEEGDCDDADPSAYPGAEDTPDDGVDQDCDGVDSTIERFGACCVNDICVDDLEEPECAAASGAWFGAYTECVDFTEECGLPASQLGACCLGETCVDLAVEDCVTHGGRWQVGACDDPEMTCCTDTVGACCLDGACLDITERDCGELGGDFSGIGVQCSTVSCPVPSDGGCASGGAGGAGLLVVIAAGAAIRRRPLASPPSRGRV